jgi:hypothetical protein
MTECLECGDEFTVDDGCDDDGICHPCAHAIAEGQISSQCSARDLTIRDLRADLAHVTAEWGEYRRMYEEDHAALMLVSGALVDAATVPVEPYHEGVRALAAQRDAAMLAASGAKCTCTTQNEPGPHAESCPARESEKEER